MGRGYEGTPDLRSALDDSWKRKRQGKGGCLVNMFGCMMLAIIGIGILAVGVSCVQSVADKAGVGTSTREHMYIIEASPDMSIMRSCTVSEDPKPDLEKYGTTENLTPVSDEVLNECRANIGKKVTLETDLTGQQIRDIVPEK